MCSNPAICYLRRIVSRISRNRPYAFYGVHASCYIQIRLCVPYACLNKSCLFWGHNNMYVRSADTPSRTLNHNSLRFDKINFTTLNPFSLTEDCLYVANGDSAQVLRSSGLSCSVCLPTLRDSRNVGKQIPTNPE